MPDPVLDLCGVIKEFGDAVVTRVLHGIDLRVMPGEFAALIGPSGSGKSTLLNLVGLLDRPTSGEVRVQGERTDALADDERTALRARSLGFVFQFHHLIGALSAVENVMMALAVRPAAPDPRDAAAQRRSLSRGRPRRSRRRGSAAPIGRAAAARRYRPGAWSVGRRWCWPMSRPVTSTPRPPTRSSRSCARSTQEQGIAFLIVTHDPRSPAAATAPSSSSTAASSMTDRRPARPAEVRARRRSRIGAATPSSTGSRSLAVRRCV
jgi:lipoprotein-releasing system ATP-binding protein